MSGFERSAPIPGSQGPRRSKMVRFNNAPPPLTPWRAEVLEAQRQIESLNKRGKSASRSRSRDRRPRDRNASGSKGHQASGTKGQATGSKGQAPAAASRRPPEADLAPDKGVILRQARERGEGWYAAVAKASKHWDTVSGPTEVAGSSAMKQAKGGVPPRPDESQVALSIKKGSREKESSFRRKGEKEKSAVEVDSKTGREKPKDADDEDQKREAERLEQERQRAEFEAKAEERRQRAEDEKRRVEEERRRAENAKKQRQQRLKGAFAVDDDVDEDDREVDLVRKAAERKKTPEILVSRASDAAGLAISTQLALPSKSSSLPVDPEFNEHLRVESNLNTAEAFMRLQERKRKGRRAEFGGPPRGCSPWRDGKRGITFEKDEKPK